MNKTSVNRTPILHSEMPRKTDNIREVRYRKQWENNSTPKASTQFHRAHCTDPRCGDARHRNAPLDSGKHLFPDGLISPHTIGSGHAQNQLWCRKFFPTPLLCFHVQIQLISTGGVGIDSKILGSEAKAEFESRFYLFPIEGLDDVVYLTLQPSF